MKTTVRALLVAATLIGGVFVSGEETDPYLWLEEIDGERALNWAREQNERSLEALKAHPRYEAIHERLLEIYNSDDRIPNVSFRGDYLYNFWQDETNKRGLWRRTTLASYRQPDPEWETVLDIDSLGAAEGEEWVFKGTTYLEPGYDRVMLRLSRGGGDAVVIREFDTVSKTFVEDGFRLEEAKSGVSWKGRDTLLVGTDFGEGALTDSGYPRIAKAWVRGQPLSDAQTLYEGESTDVGVWGSVITTPERIYEVIWHAIDFHHSKKIVVEDGEPIALDIPLDADLESIYKNQMVIRLKTAWEVEGETFPQGALISIDYDRFLAGDRDFQVIVVPDERSSISQVSRTRDLLLVNMMTNVRSELFEYSFADGAWSKRKVDAPPLGTIRLSSTDETTNRYLFYYENFLTPESLYLVEDAGGAPGAVKRLPHFFDAGGLVVEQFEAASKDGTMIPYFVVRKADQDGPVPTLLYGYGGFEISLQPNYSAVIGSGWIEQGGAYVVANIRGGGEFGPKWHLAALKENRQRSYDDFATVAEDLIERKVTTPKQLGIRGGSNGGLLVGVAFTQRPDLYNAVVCAVPLLDMKRYNKLLAGASWMAEYGNPDVEEEWAYISEYSPYQNLEPDADYPRVFFYTSTRDDRVHPGHARKMVARMREMGHEVLYYENMEGGHAAATTNEQRAMIGALQYVYLLGELGE